VERICVGLCHRNFPSNRHWLGELEKSIGLKNKNELWIGGLATKLAGEDSGAFESGDVIGLGLTKPDENGRKKCVISFNFNNKSFGSCFLGSFLGRIKTVKKNKMIRMMNK
jgi:hypothetical protein